jgi:hypothetical protein
LKYEYTFVLKKPVGERCFTKTVTSYLKKQNEPKGI